MPKFKKDNNEKISRGTFFRNNLTAQHKYILYGGAMLFLVILLMSIISLIIFSNALDQKERESTEVRVEYVVQAVESEIDAYRRLMETMYIDDSLHAMILECAEEPEFTLGNQSALNTGYSYYYENLRDLELYIARLISSCEYHPELKLYIDDSLLYYKYSTEYIDSVSNIVNENWYKEANEEKRIQMKWKVSPCVDDDGNQSYMLSCSLALRRIRYSRSDRIAYVLLENDINWLDKPIRKQIDTQNGDVYIMDNEDRIIYSSGENGSAVCNMVRNEGTGSSGYISLSNSEIAYYDKIESMDWTLVYYINAREYLPGTYPFQLFSLICLVPIILLSLILLLVSSRFMTKRLAALTKSVSRIDENHLELKPQYSGKDEVGVLSDAFCRVLSMVRELLERNKEAERERYRTELQILQERINPHFLYNTLSSINAMAVDIDAWSISEALSSLADFYRLSLSHSGEVIAMREELDILEKYLDICRLRFGDGVRVMIDVPEQFYDNKTPKLILQPFLENSILHGLRTCGEDQQDEIIVSAEMEGDDLLLCIRDNGMGIESEKLKELTQMSADGRYHAISSTDRRIKLIYGQQYGVMLKSAPGKGTTVYIRIPNEKITKDDEKTKRLEQF